MRPLRPRIRLRVGVSGHRVPPKLPAEAQAPVRATVDRVLAAAAVAANAVEHEFVMRWPRADQVAGSQAGAAAQFVVISALAEGADRIVAESGLAAGYTLEAVLPFARDEYAHDFETADSRAAFDRLLGVASSVFELNGGADARPRAYEAAGLVMLANVDLLIAIWDGEQPEGFGGTGEIVSRAIADGIPIVWINPTTPDRLQFSWSQGDAVAPAHANAQPHATFHEADEARVRECITEILRPPPAETGPSHTWLSPKKAPLDVYMAERERRWNWSPWYPLLLRIFAGRSLKGSFRLPDYLDDSTRQWQEHYFGALPPDRAQRPAIESILLPAFSVADHLAVYYSLVYRGAYVFNFIFAAIASALAVIDFLFPGPGYLVLAELVVILLILGTWGYGTMRGWHRRWLEYRRLAECLRHMRILAPVGSGGSLAHPGHGLDADEQDWVNWYAWSLRRLLPLPDAAVDDDYVTKVRDAVRKAEITEQRAYHKANDKRMNRLNENLERVGMLLFGLTVVTCVILYFYPPHEIVSPVAQVAAKIIAGLTALLPTAGAALGAIHVQGDFRTAAEQSRRTEKRLATIDEFLQSEAPDFARLTDRIEHASRVMMADLRDWQTVFRTRRLARP